MKELHNTVCIHPPMMMAEPLHPDVDPAKMPSLESFTFERPFDAEDMRRFIQKITDIQFRDRRPVTLVEVVNLLGWKFLIDRDDSPAFFRYLIRQGVCQAI